MKAYKFRSSSQLSFALDIVFNKRLYCADWRNLNDPMEGMFAYSYGDREERDVKEEVAKLIEQKRQIKICSLSSTFDCHLLWAHYASGFDGLAVEVELPDDDVRIKPVRYGGVFASVAFGQRRPSHELAEQVLSSKYQEWAYEREIRVLHHGEWYHFEKPVKRIIAGHRMNPALFKALQIVCERQNITLCRTGIGDEGIDADRVPSLEDQPVRRKRRQVVA